MIRDYIKKVGNSCVTDDQKLSFYNWVGRLHDQGIISDDTLLYISNIEKSKNNDKKKTREVCG